MSIANLEEAFKLWEENKEKGYISGPKNEELILLAEQALSLKFPQTYRLFLKKYGCGNVEGIEIYGLTKTSDFPFKESRIPDGIWLTLDERERENLPLHFIIIADTGDGYWYCLDASQVNAYHEYPVVIWGLDMPEEKKEKVNEDFGEFLLEQIQQSLDFE